MRFAVLFHQLSEGSPEGDHFDLLLEYDDKLLTWRLPLQPFLDDNQSFAAPLPEHRLVYLSYEGPISGDRGHVRQVAAGELVWIEIPGESPHPLRAKLKAVDDWEVILTPPLADNRDWVVEWHRLG